MHVANLCIWMSNGLIECLILPSLKVWGSCINMIMVGNGRIWGIGMKIPVFGFEPRRRRTSAAARGFQDMKNRCKRAIS